MAHEFAVLQDGDDRLRRGGERPGDSAHHDASYRQSKSLPVAESHAALRSIYGTRWKRDDKKEDDIEDDYGLLVHNR